MTLTLAPIFSSGMILQRELPIRVWGHADPGSLVNVCIQGKTASCAARQDGSWDCMLLPLDTSDEETLEIWSDNARIVLTDVAVGEVFIAGG